MSPSRECPRGPVATKNGRTYTGNCEMNCHPSPRRRACGEGDASAGSYDGAGDRRVLEASSCSGVQGAPVGAQVVSSRGGFDGVPPAGLSVRRFVPGDLPMAMPTLYWMLECGTCRVRRVVHDCYLEFVGTGNAPGEGYGGRPLEYRYDCLKGCPGPTRVVGSIFSPTDTEMWLHQPHKPIQLDQRQSEEWWRLLREAGFEVPESPVVARERTRPVEEAWNSSEERCRGSVAGSLPLHRVLQPLRHRRRRRRQRSPSQRVRSLRTEVDQEVVAVLEVADRADGRR